MKPIRQAVILAGGQGLRMRPLTLRTPKPMLQIHGKPFLAYLIEHLKKEDIEEVIILVGYLHKQIEEYFGDGKKFDLTIKYSYDPVEADTGTRINNARHLFDKYVLLLYGDNYWPMNLDELINFYIERKKKASVVVFSNFDHSTKNNMYVDKDGVVNLYDRSRTKPGLNGVDIGFFILDTNVLSVLSGANCSFEDTVVLSLAKTRQLAGFLTNHKYYSLSNPQRIPGIQEYFRAKKVVFLDRDGTINKRPPNAEYVTTWKEFIFLPRVKEAFELLQKKGYEMYIISSQAGIARGILTEKQVDVIHDRLQYELRKLGVTLSGVYMCPHDWNEDCFCRKPKPGLFFQAASDHSINLFEAYCIGDDKRDIIAGNAAGCKTFLIDQKHDLYSIVNKFL